MSQIQGRFFDYRPFGPRDPDEVHRAATPLELFFDLVFVIAIASAAVQLHHGIAENHTLETVPIFLFAFNAIWWAWMNYTWFASAYDNDGPIYRLLTFWIMSGALLLAASIPQFFNDFDITLPVLAYVVMRIGMVALWLIAAQNDPGHRQSALRYVWSISAVQILWVGLALWGVPGTPIFLGLLLLGLAAEMCIPVYAERAAHTPWHRDHIVERFGLLMIITLGEILLAGSIALTRAYKEVAFAPALVEVAIAGLIVAFSMWWLYFSRDEHLEVMEDEARDHSFIWSYGHFIPFCSAAAVGAGFAVMVDIVTDHAEAGMRSGYLSVAIPLAAYMFGLWLIRDRLALQGVARHILLLFAALVLCAGFIMPSGLAVMAVLSAVAVWVRSFLATRARRNANASA